MTIDTKQLLYELIEDPSTIEIRTFPDWYEGQGEQDAEIWFECRKDEGEIDIGTMYVDYTKPYEWQDNTLIAWLKI